MKRIGLLTGVLYLLVGCGGGSGGSSGSGDGGNPPPTNYVGTMTEVINQYRQDQGLAAIAVSNSLLQVANLHVQDLQNFGASVVVGDCNLHSWSNQGAWTPCCYTPDHSQAECMWNKPSEITGGLYTANGYEIAAFHGGEMTPNRALELWLGDPLHTAVMLNEGIWAGLTWNAIGGAVSANYAVVWFGEQADPAGSP